MQCCRCGCDLGAVDKDRIRKRYRKEEEGIYLLVYRVVGGGSIGASDGG